MFVIAPGRPRGQKSAGGDYYELLSILNSRYGRRKLFVANGLEATNKAKANGASLTPAGDTERYWITSGKIRLDFRASWKTMKVWDLLLVLGEIDSLFLWVEEI